MINELFLDYIIVIIQYLMSSLIDNLVFEPNKVEKVQLKDNYNQQQVFSGLCRNIQPNEQQILYNKKGKTCISYSRIDHQQERFMLKFTTQKETLSTRICIYLLDDCLFDCIKSKQNQIIISKQLLKREKQFPSEVNFYIQNGNIKMVMNNVFLPIKSIKKTKLYDLYNRLINRNILNFEMILQKYLKLGKSAAKNSCKELQIATDFQKQLSLGQSLSTINSNIDGSQQKMQFKFINENTEKQKNQLQKIQKNIVKDPSLVALEKQNKCMFKSFPEQFGCQWMATHFLEIFQTFYPKFKKLAQLSINTEKDIEDYIFNTVSIQIKQSFAKPIGEGGFSFIYAAKACLTFISSKDHEVYSIKGKQHKVERIIAIKKIKVDDKKQRQKIQHQKDIISKLKGSCCHFIPKYYGTSQKQDLSNSLIMEYIQGQQLDHFLSTKQDTVSLWTKVFILLNIVYSMKHLVSYSIVHLDLKPINILICKFLLTKVIDFGEAYNQDVCPKNYCPGFTFPYVAPEVYVRYLRQCYQKGGDDLQFSEKQDVFAFGNIMFEVFFNTKMFHLSNSKFRQVYAKRDLLQRIFLTGEKLQSYGDGVIMSTLALLIVRCLDPEPKCRPKFDWIGITLKLILNSYISNS